MLDERLLPQDLDAEMAVIGSMMMDRSAVDDVLSILGNGDGLYLPVHREVYRVLCTVYTAGKPIDLTIVENELHRLGKLETAGGREYLIQLAESFGDWHNAKHYARIVMDKYQLREVYRVASQAQTAVFELNADASILADVVVSKLEEVVQSTQASEIVDIVDLVERLPQTIQLRYVPTEFQPHDYAIGGLEMGALTILAARPSTGKTALAVHLMLAAMSHEVGSLLFSREMAGDSIAARVVSNVAEVSGSHFKRHMSPDDQESKVRFVMGQLRRGKMFVDDRLGNVRDIAASARAYVRTRGVGLIVVDYLQLCRPASRGENRNLEVGSMMAAFKSLAMDTGAAVLVLSQLSRTPKGATVKPPDLQDLRDSGSIEQDADVVWMLFRDSKTDECNVQSVGVYVRKNRNGPTMRFEVMFDRPKMRWADAPRQGE